MPPPPRGDDGPLLMGGEVATEGIDTGGVRMAAVGGVGCGVERLRKPPLVEGGVAPVGDGDEALLGVGRKPKEAGADVGEMFCAGVGVTAAPRLVIASLSAFTLNPGDPPLDLSPVEGALEVPEEE